MISCNRSVPGTAYTNTSFSIDTSIRELAQPKAILFLSKARAKKRYKTDDQVRMNMFSFSKTRYRMTMALFQQWLRTNQVKL